MKKILLLLTILFQLQAQAFVATTQIPFPVFYLAGYLGTAGGGLYALSCYTSQKICSSDDKREALGILLVGLIMLDDDSQREPMFESISKKRLLEIGLTSAEADEYLENIDELPLALSTVNANLYPEITPEEIEGLWDEQKSIIGIDAIEGLKKILIQNTKEE